MKKIILFISLVALIIGVNAQTPSPTWLTTGNAATTSSNFLGTTDCNPLIFRTNNQERMYLMEEQPYLGIGTLSPQASLHVHHPALVGTCMYTYPIPLPLGYEMNLLRLTTGQTTSGFSISYKDRFMAIY